MKKIISLFTCMMLCFGICFTANAADTTNSSTASYDLEKGGKQEFTLVNSEGDTVYVTIEQDASRTVANGTYTVSAKSSTNTWKATYKVTVKSNAITALSSPSVTPFQGSIKNIDLKLKSSKSGSLYFTWSYLISLTNYEVRTTLTSSALKVTVI